MSFEDLLLELVAPHLQPLGYAVDSDQRAAVEVCGFSKALADGTYARVQFQVRASAPAAFTINLLRENGGQIRCGARLSTVLWYVYGLRVYPTSDYWWPTSEAALRDATEKIVQYGVPWIEDAQASKPWEMPAHDGCEFVAAVEQIMTPVLQPHGYRLQQQALAGAMPYAYFVRNFTDGTHGVIELQNVYSLDPHEFQFDVRLQRRTDDNPLALDSAVTSSLAQVVWQAHGAAVAALTVAEAKTLMWHYADRAELDAQLRAALAQIEQIGLPWIAGAHDRSK